VLYIIKELTLTDHLTNLSRHTVSCRIWKKRRQKWRICLPPTWRGWPRGFGMIMGLTAGEMDYEAIRQIMNNLEGYIDLYGPQLLEAFGMEEEMPKEMAMLDELFDAIPPEIMELPVNYVLIENFREGL